MSNKDYIKFQHVEKLGTSEVQDILFGEVYVFPKIDGTNAHVWFSDGEMHYGSRTRELSLDRDNAGFMSWAMEQENITDMCRELHGCHVYGEWLVPHSLKTYRDDAWRRFYVFDVTYINEAGQVQHMPYNAYKLIMDNHGVEYIPPQRILINPSIEHVMRELDGNHYLIADGNGAGEGVVLKNYDFFNKYGRQTWAKVVTSDFKEKHHKEMGAPVTKCTALVEQEIVDALLADDIIDKAYANIIVQEDGWSSKLIPRLLETVWHDFVKECSYDAVKKFNLPTINYKTLKALVIRKVKDVKTELF